MQKKRREKIMLNKKMTSHLIYVILTLIFITSCSVTQQSEKSDKKVKSQAENSVAYKNALSAMKNGELKQAQSLLQDVINKDSTFSNAHANLGIVFFKSNFFNEAENSFQHALRTDPNNVFALNYLGILYRQQGDFSSSKSSYEKAININSDYALAHLNIGILYDLYLYDYSNAIKHYKKYQGLTKNNNKQVEKWIIDLDRRQNKSQDKK